MLCYRFKQLENLCFRGFITGRKFEARILLLCMITKRLPGYYIHVDRSVNMSSSLPFVFLVLINIPGVFSCHTFNNTKLTVLSRTGERIQTSVTGCIERKTLEVTATEIYVKDEKILWLRKDDVRHLVRLTAIAFENCRIMDIEPALFRNVPQLKSVKIAFNDIIEIKAGIFTLPSLEVLELNNNNIEQIEDGAFDNSITLKEVHCDHNLLEEWNETWFNTSTNVEVMDFQFNKIKIFPNFSGFAKLKVVRFDHNELEIIQPEAFKGLARLDYLGLRYNRLKSIDWKIFPWDFSIGIFSIGANYLNYLPRRVMAMITVEEMEIEGNPWKCPCLDQVFHWLFETNATVKKEPSCAERTIPICSYSSTYPYICLEKIDAEVTQHYLQKLKLIEPPLDQSCARLG